MSGEPVCTLIDHKTYAKTDAEIYWDGRDSRGRRVRNGRYLLSATLTPTGGGRMKSLIRPVVVYE
jgi:flagellar hook assembly protein FlgD